MRNITLTQVSPKLEKVFISFDKSCLTYANQGAYDGEAMYHLHNRCLQVAQGADKHVFEAMNHPESWELYDVAGSKGVAKVLATKLMKAEEIIIGLNDLQKYGLSDYLKNKLNHGW